MVDINQTVSIITLNIKDLNTSIKRQTVRVDQKTRPGYMLFTRNSLQVYRHIYITSIRDGERYTLTTVIKRKLK